MLRVGRSIRCNGIHSKQRIYFVSLMLFIIFIACIYGPLLYDVPNHSRRLWLQKDHKRLFPIDRSDVWGLLSASLAVMIAAGGGIGGGGMLVPIYILVMGFTAKYAIPLSNVTVFGGALGNTTVNWKKRHPFADRPLIDWDLILIMEPLTIGGALVGSLLNKILPEDVIVIMLVVLLTFIAYTTIAKAFSMYKEESEYVRKSFQPINDIQIPNAEHFSHVDQQPASVDISSDRCEILDYDEKISELSELMATNSSGSNSCKAELLEILKDESKTPLKKVAFITGLFLLILLIDILKGGGSNESGSTLAFWLANAFMLLCIIVFFFFSRAHLTREYHVKKKHRYKYVEGDIEWSEKATIVYPFLCCFAGFFSGMFGIGGGIVKVRRSSRLLLFSSYLSSYLSFDLMKRKFFIHGKGATYVTNGSESCRCFCFLFNHDSVHMLYSNCIICYIWLIAMGLCICLRSFGSYS
jgi:uncharacterized membrane protein YfcA